MGTDISNALPAEEFYLLKRRIALIISAGEAMLQDLMRIIAWLNVAMTTVSIRSISTNCVRLLSHG